MVKGLSEIIKTRGRTISFILLVFSFVLSSYYIPIVIDSSIENNHRKLTLLNEELDEIQNRLIEFHSVENKEIALRIKYNIPLQLRNDTKIVLNSLSPGERNEILLIKIKGLETLVSMDDELDFSLMEMDFQQLEDQKLELLSNLEENLRTRTAQRLLVTEKILDVELKKSRFTLVMTFIQVLGLFFAYIAEK